MEKKVISGIEVEIYKKKVKNLRIKVANGKVVMTVPYLMPESKFVSLFNSKLDWVKKHLKNKKPNKPPFTYKSGEEFYLFGEKVKLRVEISPKKQFYLYDGELILFVKNIDTQTVKNDFENALKNILLEKSKPYFEKWVRLTGLKHQKVRIHKTLSRWGSCNVKTRNINLSLYLANLPLSCIDYVVLHELCHLQVANHGQDFKALLSRYMQGWELVKAYMRDNAENFRLKLD
ncbi:MAG: M48 family metallopeptidase [Clostridia bacterium]|nr:M48 family metallopeptidase [Clostridia bacterium]